MSDNYEDYMDAYDYYQYTGELAECFEDDDEEEESDEDDEYDEEYEEETEYEPQNQNTMSNTKLKYLNELTEMDDAAAAKYGAELKSFVYREICDYFVLFMEFAPIEGKRPKGDLNIDVVLYDKDGDILQTDFENIESRNFKGFEIAKFDFYNIHPSDVGRIRIKMTKE